MTSSEDMSMSCVALSVGFQVVGPYWGGYGRGAVAHCLKGKCFVMMVEGIIIWDISAHYTRTGNNSYCFVQGLQYLQLILG